MVAAVIAGGMVIGTVGTMYASGQASDAASSGSAAAAQATIAATAMQVAEIRRQFDYQQSVLQPMIQQQYAAQRAYTDLLGIGGTTIGGEPGGDYKTPAPAPAPSRGVGAAPTGQPGLMTAPPPGSGSGTGQIQGTAGGTGEIQPTGRDRSDLWEDPAYGGSSNGVPLPTERNYLGSGGGPGMAVMPVGKAEYEEFNPNDTSPEAREDRIAYLQARRRTPGVSDAELAAIESEGARIYSQTPQEYAQDSSATALQDGRARMPPSGSTKFLRGHHNEFLDPNLDQTRLADVATLGDEVRGNLLAGTGPDDDPFRQYVAENTLTGGTAEESALVQRADNVRLAQGAAGTGVYGDVFNESAGYGFSREQMERQVDRKNSKGGGNYGGAALMEAQRRAKGLADQEYYNWAGGRERDLSRRAGAEAKDIQRGDLALVEYEQQRKGDVGRSDQAYINYLGRREGDAARLDSAAQQHDQLTAADLQRKDQAYYNYLQNLSSAAGFSNAAGATVDASKAAGGAVAGAYKNQGNQLATNYTNLGNTQAQIGWAAGTGYANAANAGVENYLTYQSIQAGAG